MTPLLLVEVLCIALCLGGIAFFSVSEASMVATNRLRLRRYLDEEDADPQTGEVLEMVSGESQQVLATVIVGINIPVLLASALTTHLTLELSPHSEHLVELVSLCMITVILVFCEILPKSYGMARAEQVAVRVARAMHVLMVVLHWPTRVVMSISQGLIRLFGGRQVELTEESVSEEDLRELVEVGQEEGVLAEDERRLLDGVFHFGEAVAREVMVPRTDMVCVDTNATFDQVLHLMQETGHSRIPMYEDDKDSIIGVVYLNDLLARAVAGETETPPHDCLREPVFVPETKNVDDLFRELQARKVHIAMVVDEHGGIAGLVTMEDVLEEIFGEIRDEHDESEEETLLVRATDGTWLVDGRATVDEVAEALSLELPKGEFDTLAGLLADLAGRLPAQGEQLAAECGLFEVVEVEDFRIRKVRITPATTST